MSQLNVKKAIEEGEKLLAKKNRYELRCSELHELRTICNGNEWNLLTLPYELGFYRGYRAALKKIKENQRMEIEK